MAARCRKSYPLERLLLSIVCNQDGRGTDLHSGHRRRWHKMLSLILLGLCLASGLAGACILVLTRIEMRESD
jgi:hypothetical protein